MPRIRTLEDLAPTGLEKRPVLVRVDYNVPLTDGGGVADYRRIEATLPTLRHLQDAGARIVLMAHLGRPQGAPAPELSLAPVAESVSDLLEGPVPLLTDPPGSEALQAAVEALEPGGAALLENIRFHPQETRNDPAFARALASLARVFVGEAFGVAHRAHASNVGAARVIREDGGPAVAGFLMERELRFLREAIEAPERPFLAVVGGAKISGKIDLIEAILPRVDRILVGGAMANTFFRALGLETGESLVERDRVAMARELLDRAGDQIVLPVDCVVAAEISSGAETRDVDRSEVPGDARIADIGPRSRELFRREILEARTVVWNGPMGVFEMEAFAEGTSSVARSMAEAADGGALVVVGGGDSALAVEEAELSDRMSHVSTGGGASLDLLAGKSLPGVEILETVEEG